MSFVNTVTISLAEFEGMRAWEKASSLRLQSMIDALQVVYHKTEEELIRDYESIKESKNRSFLRNAAFNGEL